MAGKVIFAVLLLAALTAATHKRPHKCHGHHCRDQDDDAASDAQQRLRRASGSALAPVINNNGSANATSSVSSGKPEGLAALPPVIRVIRAGSNGKQGDSKKSKEGGDGKQKPPKIEIQPPTPGTTPPGSPIPIPKGSAVAKKAQGN